MNSNIYLEGGWILWQILNLQEVIPQAAGQTAGGHVPGKADGIPNNSSKQGFIFVEVPAA